MELSEHHKAWLSKHRKASIEFLREACAAGFDVHHIDEDHGNNDPDNLILIYSGDHALLHKLGMMDERGGCWEKAKERTERGRIAYDLRAQGKAWYDIAEQIGVKNPCNLAKIHAASTGKEWPLSVPRAKPKVITRRERIAKAPPTPPIPEEHIEEMKQAPQAKVKYRRGTYSKEERDKMKAEWTPEARRQAIDAALRGEISMEMALLPPWVMVR